ARLLGADPPSDRARLPVRRHREQRADSPRHKETRTQMTQRAPLPHRHVLTCPTMPASVRLARETAEMAFASWGINPGHPTLGPALLTLSELVTNSVRHASAVSPQLTVVYAAGEDTLAFAV